MTYVQPFDISDTEEFLDVQSGNVTLSDGSASVTDTITAVDTSKAILIFSYNTTGSTDETRKILIHGEITDSTTLTFSHSPSTSQTFNIEWYVLEGAAASLLSVQRGSGDMDPEPANITLTAVDTARSFPMLSLSRNSFSYNDEETVSAEITSTTNLQLVNGDGAATSDLFFRWQVIEHPAWDVELKTISLTGTSINTSITAVNLSTALCFATGRVDSNPADNGQIIPRYDIDSTTNVRFTRLSSTGTYTIKAYIVETNGDMTIENVRDTISGGSTTKANTITAVDTARAALKLNTPNISVGVLNNGTDFDGDDGCVQMKFNSSTETQATRIASTDSCNFAADVMVVN